ncbi:29524_t:CDS:2 [Gigaspora margarita]|uniref:29524_t:CDS:1 n=1 Tax=Gigaspora margarita TaxID=4874 RepID=A0ABN7V404_GIGMA|nr:29524_t:CDS:2 [Gigaspora margarita]
MSKLRFIAKKILKELPITTIVLSRKKLTWIIRDNELEIGISLVD